MRPILDARPKSSTTRVGRSTTSDTFFGSYGRVLDLIVLSRPGQSPPRFRDARRMSIRDDATVLTVEGAMTPRARRRGGVHLVLSACQQLRSWSLRPRSHGRDAVGN